MKSKKKLTGKQAALLDVFVECWDKPYILDTKDKVVWANRMRAKTGSVIAKWVIGDNCWYKPNEDL